MTSVDKRLRGGVMDMFVFGELSHGEASSDTAIHTDSRWLCQGDNRQLDTWTTKRS